MHLCDRLASRLAGLTLVALSTLGARAARADVAVCIAASEQGISLRRAGKLREARAQLASCASQGCPEELRAECGKRIDGLNAAIPSLVIAARSGAGADILNAEVSLDGAVVATALDGRPLEVDPGEHVVRVAATGLPASERTLVVREGERGRRETFVLGPVVAATPAPTASTRAWGTRQTFAVASGAAGLVGVGVGATFGLLASSSWSSSKAAAITQNSCASAASCAAHTTAQNDHDTAVTDATISDIAFGVGAALVVVGVVTWLTAPTREATAPAAQLRVVPTPARDGGGLTVLGAF